MISVLGYMVKKPRSLALKISIKKLVHYSLYRSIRDRKFNATDKIPELISPRTTLVHILRRSAIWPWKWSLKANHSAKNETFLLGKLTKSNTKVVIVWELISSSTFDLFLNCYQLLYLCLCWSQCLTKNSIVDMYQYSSRWVFVLKKLHQMTSDESRWLKWYNMVAMIIINIKDAVSTWWVLIPIPSTSSSWPSSSKSP